MKDLPHHALLASVKSLDAKRVRAALEQTFGFRKTHDLPVTLPEPPTMWAGPYAAMALEEQLRWPTLGGVTAGASAFLDPILAGGLDAGFRAGWAAAARGKETELRELDRRGQQDEENLASVHDGAHRRPHVQR